MLSYKKQDVYFSVQFWIEYQWLQMVAIGHLKKKVLTTDDNFVNITILPHSNSILADKHLWCGRAMKNWGS